jgi:hypothetical protein
MIPFVALDFIFVMVIVRFGQQNQIKKANALNWKR